jgi:ABC-type transport system involved in cytochrome bd biosynthesis fused ATPase/permease subunit
LVQPKLAKLSQEGMRESSIRNALLVEAVQGMDDIKLLRAEPRFQNQWNHMNEVSADISMKQRMIGGLLGSWTQTVQSLMYVLVILAGSYMVMDGTMTTGALVACSILASRMVAPLANLTGLFVRLQQAKVAKKGLDELMQKDVDQSDAANQVQRPVLHGNYQLQGMGFKYNEKDSGYVLAIGDLKIKAGEKIALLGKNGSGKTTLLQLLSGLQYASTGKTMLDGLDMSLIDPSDVRRDVGFLTQQASLFFGSIRENVTLGAPLATDEAILRTLQFVGLQDFVQSRKEGLDSLILEGGIGLSGGQKQALLLARTMIREPNVLLLDEPTAWLDEVSEKRFIDNMREWMGHRTLIIATHRMAVLSLVDRIIVLNDGKLVKDGRKDDILPPTGAPQQPSPALRQQQVSANTGVAAEVEQAKAEQQAVVVATQAAAKVEAPKPQTADVTSTVVETAVAQPPKPVVVSQAAEATLTAPKPVQPTVAPVIPTVVVTQAASTPAKPVVLDPETGEPIQPAQKAEAEVTTPVVAAKQEAVVPSVHPAVVEQMAQAAKRAKTLQTPAVAQPVTSHSVEIPKLDKQEAVAAKAETAKPAEVAVKSVATEKLVSEQSAKSESKAQPESKVVEPAIEKPAATSVQTADAATTNKAIAVSEAKPTVSAVTTAKPVASAAPANAVPVKAQSVSNATVEKELAKAQPAVSEPVAKAVTQPQPIVSSVTAKAPTQAQSATSADKSKEVAQAVTKTTAAKASTPAQPVSAKTTAQTQPAAVTAVVKQAAQAETKSVVVQAATVQGKPAPVSGIVKQTAETPQAQAVKPVTTPQTQATAEQPAASAGQAVAFPVYALKLALHRAGGKLPDETQPENVAYLQNLRNLQNK